MKKDVNLRQLIFFKPAFAHKPWGGTGLREEFGYDEPGDDIGECWGISAYPGKESTVADGDYAGLNLGELWRDHRELFGDVQGEEFPLLTKIISASDDLSVQVHPDDAYASEHENGARGKTECWYILDAEPGSRLAIGHNAATREELTEMIEDDRWDELIRYTCVEPGDFVQIPSGTVHAIGGGVTLLETQQNSDITYRLYDYDRITDGSLRPLHKKQSEAVITVPAPEISGMLLHDTSVDDVVRLMTCEYYEVYRITCRDGLGVDFERPFVIMSVVEGEGTISVCEDDKQDDADIRPVRKGDHFIVSAGTGMLRMSGSFRIIASCLPQ